MTLKITPLSPENHGKLNVRQSTFSHIQKSHMLLATADEFVLMSIDMPVVFVKNPETGQFQSVGLTGIESGENVFFKDGNFNLNFIPANAQAAPFTITNIDDERAVICIDESSDLVSDSEGSALFDEDGNQTDFMKSRTEFILDVVQRNQSTSSLIKWLADKELFKTETITIFPQDKEKSKTLNGLYIVDEKKLNKLSDEDFLFLRHRGCLAPIYAHLSSLKQLSRIISLSELAKT